MTTYTTLVVSDFDPEQPITTQKANAWYYNCVAITEKAAGAPVLANDYIVQAMISAGSVGQAELKTSTGEVSYTFPSSGIIDVVLPSGAYGKYLRGKTSNAVGSYALTMGGGVNTSYVTYVRLFNSGNYTTYAQQTYETASPPYDLGDGEIPMFIFALMSASGDVVGTYSAPEAPWHYNGPTNISADFYSNGVGYQRRMVNGEKAEIEITQSIKNADMDLIPHPFGTVPSGHTVVMLDPISDQVLNMRERSDYGESTADFMRSGIIIDNKPITGRRGPAGVQICKARIK